MENKFSRRIKDSFRKNLDEVLAFSTLSLPRFVYIGSEELNSSVIPVFNFHEVHPNVLEEQLDFLSKNGYRSLSADELMKILTLKRKNHNNSVVLTFDDGRKDFWTIAYPLLKKFDIKAVSFIIPSVITDRNKSATREEVWSGKIKLKEIDNNKQDDEFCSWPEIDEMHRSGLIDFQSHSMYHASVNYDNSLVNFVNPEFTSSILTSTYNPIETKNKLTKKFGSPVFRWTSNFTAENRYIINEDVEKICTDFVSNNGGQSFFLRRTWKKELYRVYSSAVGIYERKVIYQRPENRVEDILNDLSLSKKIIEERLNKKVNHFCYPWFAGNKRSVEISKTAGYKCNYWGIRNNTTINRPGDDPMYIKRLNDYYIFSLPSKSRKSIGRQILMKVKAN